MAETDIFYCEPREKTGTGGARAARRAQWVPGVLYGGGADPVAIQLKKNEVEKAFKNGRLRSHLAKIDVPGEDGQQPVIARDVQIHPVKGLPVHVDLMRVDEKTRLDVAVPVRFINEEKSPGLKKGGVLNVVRHAVEVYAPATAIPEVFELDVDGLEVGDSIHASAIKLPDGVTHVITDRDFTIATIAAPSALRSADEEAEAAEADAESESDEAGDAENEAEDKEE
ncbi:50S ribosomal protein L25/general stress protein Ctc [Hyphococcus flavus]|uniref:Large ribosomal subunit protein bL25 n=1 Tax=Hyphococcus flavus TaxID=1866326 RepID=A0AAE9ZDZ1_9PROT|nr:50S ribosomal protein L25/general stress protein Ctc [Hyphococcus flavus]WDI31222.1 50S ribosomal protein L25/general stress protein Ctc [Hyphococcus flavus]